MAVSTDLFRWPDGILPPEPLNDQYKVKPPDPLHRTDFEEGEARQIQHYSTAPGTFTVVWPMTPDQKYVFDGILANILHYGATWMALPVFTHREYQLLKCRFVKGTLAYGRSGGEWMVGVDIETDDTQPPSADDTAATLLTMGSNVSLDDLVNQLYQIVHVDMREALL